MPTREGASRPSYFQICKKVSQKVAMLQERVGNSIFVIFYFRKNSWSSDQNTPLPPTEGVSAHHWGKVEISSFEFQTRVHLWYLRMI